MVRSLCYATIMIALTLPPIRALPTDAHTTDARRALDYFVGIGGDKADLRGLNIRQEPQVILAIYG